MNNQHIDVQPGSVSIAKTGKRKWTGKNWVYYTQYTCDRCKRKITTCKRYKQNNPNRKHIFCGSICKQQYYLMQKDIKQYSILDIKDSDFYYLLGLIASDGHIKWPYCTVTAKNYSCTIELHDIDRKILENIQNKFGGSIYIRNKTHTIIWAIHNREFIEFLRSIGFTNNKSLTLDVTNWFENIDKNNQQAFIHGVFDGDGSIYFIKNTKMWGASICSCSPVFCNMLYKYFHDKGYNVKKGTVDIHFNGSYMIKPLKNIFTNTGLYMERKYNLLSEAIKFYEI